MGSYHRVGHHRYRALCRNSPFGELMYGRLCPVCGSAMLGEMCPTRYLSDHGQTMRDRVACIVFCHMAADIRTTPNREDWEFAWRWRSEEPILSAVPFPC